jgi:predicted ATPase
MRAGLEIFRLTGAEIGRGFFHTLIAEAYGKAGQPTEGLTVLAQTETIPSRAEEVFVEAELHRVRGDLLVMEGAPSSAVEPHYERALSLAREQQARSLELRAALSMSRLWLAENEPAKARALLEPVYSWFTEGFETPDLKDARALLDQFLS